MTNNSTMPWRSGYVIKRADLHMSSVLDTLSREKSTSYKLCGVTPPVPGIAALRNRHRVNSNSAEAHKTKASC